MLEEKRGKFKKIGEMIGEIFSQFGLTPNQYTLLSLFFAFFCFYFLINQNLRLATIFFALAALLDFVDGAVAKFSKKETKKGAYLDTICDRYVEGMILLGFLFLPVAERFFLLPVRVWVFLSLFGSLMTTYTKAAAKEKELIEEELKKGLFGRGERVILIFLTLFLGIFNLSWMIYPVVILAILTNITAIQRISIVFAKN